MNNLSMGNERNTRRTYVDSMGRTWALQHVDGEDVPCTDAGCPDSAKLYLSNGGLTVATCRRHINTVSAGWPVEDVNIYAGTNLSNVGVGRDVGPQIPAPH